MSGLYGKTIRTGGGKYLETLPTSLSASTPDVAGMLTCLSCHDGNYASNANGVISMRGAHSSRFVNNYGFFVEPGVYSNTSVVVCTTCHDPHSMNVVNVSRGSTSGLPAGNYATLFFLRGPYNPADSSQSSNQTAQFCRQCHADKSNEMNGSTAGTIF